jgi:hypothetical protein
MDSDKIKTFDHGTNPVNPLVTSLSQRSYRIGSDQGIVFLAAAVIDRRYRWVVTLEPLVIVEVDELPVVPRKVVDSFGVRGFVEVDRGSEKVIKAKKLPEEGDSTGIG